MVLALHLRELNRLVFNGQVVGSRLSWIENDEIKRVFDIGVDDLHLITKDFGVVVLKSNKVSDIYLKEKGNQLVPIDAVNVSEMTYGEFAKTMGYYHLANTDVELKKLYNQYNSLCFNNELPILVGVEWSKRMPRGAGVCIQERNRRTGERISIIRLSISYHQRFPNEVVDTLVHEMIHVKHPYENHGPMFLNEMNRLNRQFGFNIKVYATGRATVKYVYACQNCGYEYERVKKLDLNRVRCGVKGCMGRLYVKEDFTDDFFDDTD